MGKGRQRLARVLERLDMPNFADDVRNPPPPEPKASKARTERSR